MVLVLLTGSGLIVMHARSREAGQHDQERMTGSALRVIQREIKVRSGIAGAELNGRGWPITIDPGWFGADVPVNALLQGSRPWLEIASPDEHEFTHPMVRQAVDRDTAAFWYNPGNGIVRARVSVMVSDKAAIEAYNRVNASSIRALVDVSEDVQKP